LHRRGPLFVAFADGRRVYQFGSGGAA